MIVDDDAEIRDSLSELLEDEGYAVVVAQDGLEALRMLKRGDRPHVVLLDLMMPNMDGWQLAREMRGDPELAEISIIVITAAGRRMGPAIEAAPVLDKPFSLESVLSLIEACR